MTSERQSMTTSSSASVPGSAAASGGAAHVRQPTQALVPSVSIAALLQRRKAIIERLEFAHKALLEANEIATAAYGDEASRYKKICLSDSRSRRYATFTEPDGLAPFVKMVDAAGWDYLLDQSGIRTFMDAKTRETWQNAIQEDDVPELTEENIYATFEHLRDTRGEMFEQGVISVFRALSWHYKTNSPVKFGKRIIMTYALSWGHLAYEAGNRLDDVVRVLCVLDGKPEPDHRQGAYRTLHDKRWPTEVQDAEINGMLSVRGFKNGNIHVTFLRPDLVAKMNAILAKHYPNALPPMKDGGWR